MNVEECPNLPDDFQIAKDEKAVLLGCRSIEWSS
jgi:hypothetical protein